ncbi:TasA family protein [Virgibacillus sp. SK37]|uniref:TasA family protein n=1 Tax=Virgibacillus sp. SK37 TaxID=403957 RepID=UPI0004D18F88|nr:TasA family protein [Virgibacillus sp. SK37]AIF44178.1 cell division protein FtsN [Virgibacillus sp. SK37]
MSIKKKLGMGIATAVLGVGLIGGGTFAYFSDQEVSANTFATGTLDLALDPSEIISVNNLKPGDWMNRTFKLENNGSLDISKVELTTDYDNEELAKHIRVNFLQNIDKSGIIQPNDIIYSTYLNDLKGTAPDAVQKKIWSFFGEKSGLKAGTTDNFYVQFEFVDNGEDQNTLQEQTLNLEWTFDAKQTDGERR